MYDFFILVTWLTISITCIIVPCYQIHVICLVPVTDIVNPVTGYMFPLLIWMFPILDMRAVDMRYVESHIHCSCYIVLVILFMLYCPRFSLYCSMLSTELRSSYPVTRIMYCNCSCYLVYCTYQIIKLIGVWGRLDGWLDHIGWCTGSILLVPLQGTVVLLPIAPWALVTWFMLPS